jgi:hypothetical protein
MDNPQSKVIFDLQKAEAAIVWDLYREVENKKFRAPDSTDEDIANLPWYRRWFRRLATLNQQTHFISGIDNEPFMLVRKYIIWFQKKGRKIADEKIVDPISLHRFFTGKIRHVAVIILVTNIFFLLMIYFIISDKRINDSNLSDDDPFFPTLRGHISQWLVSDCLCLFHFLILLNTSRFKLRDWDIDADYMWLYLGRFLAFVQILLCCQSTALHVMSQEEQRCFGLHLHGKSSENRMIFWYVFSCSIIDGIQGIIFACMPFPWPWAAIFSVIMFYQIAMRIFTCFAHVEIPDNARKSITHALIMFIFMFFVLNVALVSYTFQRSMMSSYSNTASQSELAKNTRAIVNLLCTDVKLNVRQVLKTLENLSHVLPASSLASYSFYPVLKDIQESGTVINVAVDHLIFLAKVGEGRFEFSLTDGFKLNSALEDVCKDYKRKVIADHRDIDLRVDICPDLVTTDSFCFHALVYYGLMAVDTLVQSFHLGHQMTNLIVLRGNLEDAPGASHTEVSALRITIYFTLLSPSSYKIDHKEVQARMISNGLINSCCVVCNRLVQSYGGDFLFYNDRLEFTLPILHREKKPHILQRLRSDVQSTPRSQQWRPNHGRNSFLHYGTDPHLHAPHNANETQAAMVPLAELLHKHTSLYLTVPQMESLVIDALRSLLRRDQALPVTLTVHRVLNRVDIKIRSIIFVQTWEARMELIQEGYTGDIVLCSEKMSYLGKHEKNLFSYVIPLPPSDEDLELLSRYLRHKLNMVETIQVKKTSQGPEHIGWFQKSSSVLLSGRRDSKTAYGGSASGSRLTQHQRQGLDVTPPPQPVPNSMIPGPSSPPAAPTLHRNSLSMRRTSSFLFWTHSFRSSNSEQDGVPIRLSPVPPPTLFARILNFATFAIPVHQQNNYAMWRFMNPSGDIFHHTSNAELFSVCIVALLVYMFFMKFASIRFILISIAFAVLLIYRNSLYSLVKTKISFLTFWVVITVVNGGFSVLGGLSTMVQMARKNLYFTSPKDLLTGDLYIDDLVNNGVQVVVIIIVLPIMLKFYGEFLAWPFAFLAILTQLCRAYFFVLYSFRSFLTGLVMNLLITLFTHFFTILLFNIVSTEGLFRDEFLQLHDMILARSYLEKCLVLARQLIQPLENLVDAQEAVVKAMVNETVAGRLWMQEPVLSVMKDCQVATLVTQQWMLELRLTKTSWLMQQERSEVLVHMRTVLLRNFVLSLCQHFSNESYAADPSNHVSFAVRIAPELTQIRIDEALCRATLTHICRRAIGKVQEYVQRARRMCRLAQGRQMDVSKSAVKKAPNSGDLGASKTVDPDDSNFMYWQKQSLVQHQLLLWIYPKANLAPDTNRPFRFADIRDLEMILFSSAANSDCTNCSSDDDYSDNQFDSFPLETPFTLGSKRAASVQLKSIKPLLPPRIVFHRVGSVHTDENSDIEPATSHRRTTAADVYTDYFSFTGRDLRIRPGARRSVNYDEGIVLHHTLFRSYQRVLLPYLLTPHSTWFAETVTTSPQFLARALVNHIDAVQCHLHDQCAQQLYAQYLRQTSAFFIPVASVGSVAGSVGTSRLVGVNSKSLSPKHNGLATKSSPSASSQLSGSIALSSGASTHLIFPNATVANPGSALNLAAVPNDTFKLKSSPPASVNTTGSAGSVGSGDKSSNSTSSSGSGEEEQASASSGENKDSPTSGNTSVTGSDHTRPAAPEPAVPAKRPVTSFRKPGMNVAVILSFEDTSFRQQSVNNQVMLGSVGWLGRLETLKPPHMPTSFFHEAECVFIEYVSAPPAHAAVSGSSGGQNLTVKPTLGSYGGGGYGCQPADRYFPGETVAERVSAGREYLRLVLQWLRFGGFDGIIVLLGDVAMEGSMRQDSFATDCVTTNISSSTATSNASKIANDSRIRNSVSFKYREENQRVLRSDQQADTYAFNLIMQQSVLNSNVTQLPASRPSRVPFNQSGKLTSTSVENDGPLLEEKGDDDQSQFQQQFQSQAVMQYTAVLADRYLTIPLNEEKLRSLLPDCERRVVELALGVWRT